MIVQSRSGVTFRPVFSLVSLLVLGSAALAEGVKLEYGSTPGDKSTYHMVMDGSTRVFVNDQIQESKIKTDMYLAQTVTAFKDGVITLNTKIENGKINVNGSESPAPYIGQTLDTNMKKNGEIVSATTPVPLDMKSMQLVFPTGEVEIGKEWETHIPPSQQVPVALTSKYKVIGLEKIKGLECVKISSQVFSGKDSTIQGLSLEVKADGNIYFAYKPGKMVKNEVRSSMTMILKRVVNDKEQKIITKMSMDMTMELVE